MTDPSKQAPGNDRRILVVGDIHGHYTKLRNVLALCRYDPERDRLILLGDYVDRGPDSCRVAAEVVRLVEAGAVALYGNHEDMMCVALKNRKCGHLWSKHLEQWYANGGESTLDGYRGKSGLLDDHLAFFGSLPRWHEEGGFLFVHAGIRPGITVGNQAPQDLIWIREPYIMGYEGPQDVVAGHTPVQYLNRYELFKDITNPAEPLVRGHRIFLDTGAAWGGPLTVMELPSRRFWQA